MSTIDVTKENFEELIQKDGIVFVDAWAEWCGPCKAFAPTFAKASEEHPDVTFAKLDTEAEEELAGKLGVTSIPNIIAFRDGIPLYQQAGNMPPADFESLIGQVKALDMEEVRKQYEKMLAEQGKQGE
ncbi:thiol reductase thioredoxin [Corynebacterium hadale]|uniref:Thiol reductase thioredoxin n=1 Tax=Corynebacterium hadale TaxID=2026255 RepID=A0AB36RJW7_9CORY|nr:MULTISPECIES: thioredoxin domain-containing protein [Corynebacterium]MCG7254873.1 thioredoxin domain-containing protein [Corynebacterium hadale]MCG7256369.1 thioredoxin domain-containing protein [Corynebacterium hadale]MCG7266214.1 thioredoxin domain-containing protein [Corynebacterium hadale]PAT03602.1 thiol reductase thioredoxin [Corynebacterium sp. NML 150383]PAT08720.1 thiol reductase thioredoxin [Corynebacterium hadale]